MIDLRRIRRQTTLLPRNYYPESPNGFSTYAVSTYEDHNTSPKNVDDNHKPTLHCDDYKPEVKEEQARGEFVIQVAWNYLINGCRNIETMFYR